MAKVERNRYHQRWGALKSERASWIQHWKDISDNIIPRSGRYFTSDRNRGQKRNNNIIDSTATRALRVLAAGMMGGMTSPARPWFRLASPTYAQNDSAAVREWMNEVTRLMLDVFQKSNAYRVLHSTYEELGAFGTGAFIVVPDFDNVIHCYPLTVGEYCIATDYKGRVNTMYREFQKTVHEVVQEFGLDNCSLGVQHLFKTGALDQWITIVHAIEPRSDRDEKLKDAKNKPWASVYFELGGEKDKYLRESGFDNFPVIAPRWSVSGGDIYGNSPAMESLGDVKQLQHQQLRKGQAIDYQVKPPLQVPVALKNREVDLLPAGITYVDRAGSDSAIQSMFAVNLDLNHLLADVNDVRSRINQTFYADLFLMLASQTDARMTATEVAERHEEKMLMLGTVIERLHDEMLDPLIDLTFEYMLKAGIVPEPPQELQGQAIDVEYISMLAQAQRAIGTNSIDRFVNAVGMVAQAKPEVLDKLNADKWADVYSDLLGIDPRLVLDSDEVAAIREQRAKAQQQMQQQEAIAQQAQNAKNLAGADTSSKNALTDVMGMFSGY
jgi:hypothetical protein